MKRMFISVALVSSVIFVTTFLQAGDRGPKRDLIVFVKDKKICVMDFNGKGLREITTTDSETTPVLSPNKSKIAFCTYKSIREGGLKCCNLYIIDVYSEKPRLLANAVYNSTFIVWSPNGDKILFTAMGGIYVIDVNGGNRKKLTDNYEHYYSRSPKGDKIAYASYNKEGPIGLNIYVMDANGKNKIKLTEDGADNPVWSQDGKKIFFEKYIHGGGACAIYVLDIDTKNQEKLVDIDPTEILYLRSLALSPDGKKLAFATSDTVCVMDTNGENMEKLKSNCKVASYNYYSRHPILWSSCGKKIAFYYVEEDNEYKIYAIDINSKKENELINLGPISQK